MTLNLLCLLRASVNALTLKVSHPPISVRVLVVLNDPPAGFLRVKDGVKAGRVQRLKRFMVGGAG